MRKVVTAAFVSLDGVMQAPGGPEEDPTGGFAFGGWTFHHWDDVMGQAMDGTFGEPFDLLLGRKTYDIFAGYWPEHEDNEIGEVFKKAKKYVVSDMPMDKEWEPTIRIDGDVVAKLKQLKQEHGPMLQVHGSGNMIQTLLRHDLVDALWLKIFPVTLGRGKRLFGDGVQPAAFKLVHSRVTPSGVIFASYERDGEVKTGSFD